MHLQRLPMQLRRFSWSTACLVALLLLLPDAIGGGVQAWAKETSSSASARDSESSAGRGKARKHKRARKSRGRGKVRTGRNARAEELRTAPLDKPSGNIWIYSENFREEVQVNIYRPDGSFDDGALSKLDHSFRCKRTKESRAVDPRLYEMLSRIQDHFGGEMIHLVSGFRFQRNEGSRHYHASAMDIRIPGVNLRQLREFAESLDGGGMGIGIYPNSGFVHVDFRAPGEPSYRWVDRTGPGEGKDKRRSRRWARRPNS